MIYFHLVLASIIITILHAEVDIEKDEGIFILKNENYEHAFKTYPYLLVYFYAPWCGHCKAFGPEYVKAAQILKEKDSPIKLAKVDGPSEKELLEKMHVTGYPTLFFYRNQEYIKYEGGRFANEIASWVERKIGPPATILETASSVKEFIENNEVAVIGYFKDPNSSLAKDYLMAVRDYEEYPCGITSNVDAIKDQEVKEDTVVLFKNFDEGKAVYDGAINKEKLLEFIQLYAIPLVVEFNHETAQKIFRGLVKSHILFFVSKKSEDYGMIVKMAAKLAESVEYRNKVMFVTVDTDEDDHRRIIEFLGLKEEKLPLMRIIQMKESDIEKFKPVSGQHMPQDFSAENVKKFIDDFLAGKVPQHFMTEQIPEDWDAHPVKYLTSTNFDEIVFDKTKNVLVEFYAPWCGHCKQLEPVWDKVAETLSDKKDVVVAKMDATANELPHTKIRSFPTIKLYKKDTNEDVDYNGERTEEGIIKFYETDGVYGKAAPDHDEL